MRIFVAGATGVLGRRVVPQLVSMGHQVTGLIENLDSAEWLSNFGATAIRGDLLDRDMLFGVTSDCDIIIHLETTLPSKVRTVLDDWVLNGRATTEGTANLVAAAVRNRARLFIQSSVTFLYGRRHGEWMDESCLPADDLPPLVRSYVEAEAIVQDAVQHGRLRAITLRFGNVYCRDCPHTMSMYDLVSRGNFPIIEHGHSYWNQVSADDAAGAVVAAVKNGEGNAGKVFNICDDEPVRYGEFVEFIARSIGAPKPVSIPAFLAKTAIGWQTVDYLLHSARCYNKRAKDELKWVLKFPTYREGHEEIIRFWLDREGHLVSDERQQAAI